MIEVSGRHDEEKKLCRLEISDNGSGMSDEQAQRIFEPLFTTKAKGTGLGLSICRQIIEEHHGGSITLKEYSRRGNPLYY